MKECRYCRNLIDEKDMLCSFCGYDYNTDTINQSFNHQESNAAESKKKIREQEPKLARRAVVSPGIKKFAFVGLAIVIFSILYKYNFDINRLVLKTGKAINKLKTGKIFQKGPDSKKDTSEEKVELTDVSSFDGTKGGIGHKGLLVEGIFFDPDGKSFATVNGKVLSEGDTFGHITVKKINSDWVELIVNGETEIVKVK